MPHTIIVSHHDDDGRLMFIVDRRRHPDRRAIWRGGRRDADWLNRPPGALARLSRPWWQLRPWPWTTLAAGLAGLCPSLNRKAWSVVAR